MPTLSPNINGNRAGRQPGRSEYNALIMSGRRRLSQGIDFTASYTLSSGKSTIGNATDELNTANIQDPNNPFDDPRQFGPNLTTDARHRFTLSAVWQAPWGITVAPFFLFRSALPVYLIDGRDLNLDGDILDIATTAYRATSYNKDTHRMDDRRGWRLRDGELRPLPAAVAVQHARLEVVPARAARMRIEAIGDVFNLFNALNPGIGTTSNRRLIIPTHGCGGSHAAAADAFSGDAQRPEQRVGQIGFRFSF